LSSGIATHHPKIINSSAAVSMAPLDGPADADSRLLMAAPCAAV